MNSTKGVSRKVLRLCLLLTLLVPALLEPVSALAMPLVAPGKCQTTMIDDLVQGIVTIRLENVVATNVSNSGCNVQGNMRITFPGNDLHVSNVQGIVDSQNNFTASVIPGFDLNIAGLTFKVGSAAFTSVNGGRLVLQTLRIKVPDAWGGFEGGVFDNPVYFDQAGLTTGRFKLPAIKTKKGFELEMSGGVRWVSTGYEIDADGSLAFPDTSKIPGCAIGAGVTLYWDGTGATSMQVSAGVAREPGSLEAGRSAIALPAGQTPLTPEYMPVASHYLPVPPIDVNPFESDMPSQSVEQAAAGGPYAWALWEDGQYNQPLAYSDGNTVMGLPDEATPTGLMADVQSRNVPALIGPLSAGGPAEPEAPDGLALHEVRADMSCDKGIPIGTSGFELTGVSGVLSLRPDSQFVDIGVVIESSAKLGSFSILKADADAKFQWKPEYEVSLEGTLYVFSFYKAGNALLSISEKKGFTGSIWVRGLVFEASISLRAWATTQPNFKFHFTGSAQLRLGMEKGSIWEGCVPYPCGIKTCKKWGIRYPCGIKICRACISVPPVEMWLGNIGADFGEFSNGKYGLKGYVSFMGYSIGAYVDERGNVKFGNVSGYKLVDSPTVQQARQAWLEARRQGTAAPNITQEDVMYTFPAENQVLIGFNTPLERTSAACLAPSDIITHASIITQTDTLFSVKSDLPLTVSLISPPPGSAEINASNYISKPGGFTVDYRNIVTYTLMRSVGVTSTVQNKSQAQTLAEEVRLRLVPALYEPTLPFKVVDVWLNGQRVLANASLTDTAEIDYIQIVSGTHLLALSSAGSTTPVLTATFQAISGTTYTALPVGNLGTPSTSSQMRGQRNAPAGALYSLAPRQSGAGVGSLAPLAGETCFATPNDGTTVYSSITASAVRDALATASVGGTVKVAGYCPGVQASGGTTQTVRIAQPLTLAGGYTTTNWTTPYPLAQPTILDAQGGGRVIYASAEVTLTNLTIKNGASDGHGGGAYFDYTPATVVGVNFISNTAANDGYGGGAAFFGTATVFDSTFTGNHSTSFGGGAAFLVEAAITHSTFNNNSAWADGGGAWFLSVANVTGVTFGGNIAQNQTGGGAYFGSAANVSRSTFTGNRASSGGGASFHNGIKQVVNVLFAGNEATTGAGAAVSVLDNYSYEPLNLIHTTIASPTQAAGAAVYADQYPTNVYINNTIIASHTTGIQAENSAWVEASNTLFFGNTADIAGAVSNNNPVSGNPLFVNPVADDYHIGMGSTAIDAGTTPNPDVTSDFDGEFRPHRGRYDIGYDEWVSVQGQEMFVLTDDNRRPAQFGQARLRFVNVDATNLPNATVTATLSSMVIGGLAYKQASDYKTMPAGAYPLHITDGYGVTSTDILTLTEGVIKTIFIEPDARYLETLDEDYRVFTTTQYVVDQATRGQWQVKIDGDTDTTNFVVAAVEAPNPPIVKDLLVNASNLAHTVVSYTLLSENAPIYIRIFANNGALTETLTVTETLGTITTTTFISVPLFVGEQVAAITVTNPVSNVLMTQTVDLGRLESGNYALWVRVEDSNNAPVEGYVWNASSLLAKQALADSAVRVAAEDYNALRQLDGAAVINVDNTASFSPTWTSALTATINPRFIRYDGSGIVIFDQTINGLFIEFTPNTHPDVDSYIVRVTDHLGVSHVITSGITTYDRYDEHGNFLGGPIAFATFNGIRPEYRYTIKVGAQDYETDRIAWSQPFTVSVPLGDFQIQTLPAEINLSGNVITTVVTTTLVLTMTNDLYTNINFYLESGNNLTNAIAIGNITYEPFTPTAQMTDKTLFNGSNLPTPRQLWADSSAAGITHIRASVAFSVAGVSAGLYPLPLVAYSGELTRRTTAYLNITGQPVLVPPGGGIFHCNLPQATSARGLTVTVPVGAFASVFDFYCQQGASNLSMSGPRFAGLLFSVHAFQQGTGIPVTPTLPLTFTIVYGDEWYGALHPQLLMLRTRQGVNWVTSDVACANNLTQKVLTCSVTHLSDYALFENLAVYLPVVRR